MCNSIMPHYQHIWLYLVLFFISFYSVRPSNLSTKLSITLLTPGNSTPPTEKPHKSVHVRHRLLTIEERWTIVGIEPLIQIHRKAVERLTVHLCSRSMHLSILYDYNDIFNDAQSLLIYEWTPYTSSSVFRLIEGFAFNLTGYKAIVLSVVYTKEKEIHKEQSGVILHIGTKTPRYRMGTMLVGNKKNETQFSCRSSDVPRVIYGVKRLYADENKFWWRIYVIRVRHFRRKLIQLVYESKVSSKPNLNNVQMIKPEVFFMKNDYLLVECENVPQANCHFLIYYSYKSELNKNDNICQNDQFSYLFDFLPTTETPFTNQTGMPTSKITGSKIFLIIFSIFLFIWISIIVGCIIMRRVRGLVNFRTESANDFSAQKNLPNAGRTLNEGYQQRSGEADQMMQIDIEHAGQMA